MASIVTNKATGQRRILFYIGGERQRPIHCTRMSKADAAFLKRQIEELASAKTSGRSPRPDVAQWLEGVGADVYGKLASAGLAEPREASIVPAVADFAAKYHASREDLKPGTLAAMKQGIDALAEYFKGMKINEVTPGHADAWRLWMLKAEYAEATVRKRTQTAQQVFESAVRHRLIESDPFADLPSSSRENRERLRFIDVETIQQVLEACPDAEWRLIVLLCRFGGIRCPSELLPLRWQDIDPHKHTLTITSPKTARHAGKGSRVIPLWPELAGPLQTAYDAAPEGSTYVITKYRKANANLRTQFERIIRLAGVAPWPKLFHNLRATRETELCRKFPLHQVCGWIGNTAKIAARHYLTTTESDIVEASSFTVMEGSLDPARNPARCTTEPGGNAVNAEAVSVTGNLAEGSGNTVNPGDSADPVVTTQTEKMGAAGFEPAKA